MYDSVDKQAVGTNYHIMTSPRTSATEAARERRRQHGEAQAVPLPGATQHLPAVTAEETAPTAEQEEAAARPQPAPAPAPAEPEAEEEVTFDAMIKRELEHAMELEIKKALNIIKTRQTALMAQESSITHAVQDAFGRDSDFYEDLVLAVQNKDPRVGKTKDEIYQYLYDLKFTNMRSLDALREMYPVSEEQKTQ